MTGARIEAGFHKPTDRLYLYNWLWWQGLSCTERHRYSAASVYLQAARQEAEKFGAQNWYLANALNYIARMYLEEAIPHRGMTDKESDSWPLKFADENQTV